MDHLSLDWHRWLSEPGHWLHADSWEIAGLGAWRTVYAATPSVRAAVDVLLRQRLFPADGLVPAMAGLSCLPADAAAARRLALCCGLRVLDSRQILLCRPWRDVIVPLLPPAMPARLALCMAGRQSPPGPGGLLSAVLSAGDAWLLRDVAWWGVLRFVLGRAERGGSTPLPAHCALHFIGRCATWM